MKPTWGRCFSPGKDRLDHSGLLGPDQLATGAGTESEPRRLRGPGGLPPALPASTVQYGKCEEREGLRIVAPWQGAGELLHIKAQSCPRLGLQSFHPEQETVLEPPPAPASIQVSQGSLARSFNPVFGGAWLPPSPGQHWVWGAPSPAGSRR